MNYRIKSLSELGKEYNEEVASLYVEAFNNKMKIMSNDKEKLKRIFKDSFNDDMYYIALDGDEVIGIAACSNNKKRANKFNISILKKEFGVVKAVFYFGLLKAILEVPTARNEKEGYIESVATVYNYRGKGVATSLFNHIHKTCKYEKYILDVIHGNDNAKHLYENLGYNTYKVDKGLLLKIMNVEAMYLMEYVVEEESEVLEIENIELGI